MLGYLCAIEALLLSIITRCSQVQYSPVEEDPSQMTLQERQEPSPQEVPEPVAVPVWPVDDVQPCSSKHLQPPFDMYTVA